MRVALYVRVSTQRQAQAQTIEQQLERLQSYATAQGWDITSENLFRDEGPSGATLRRPGLERVKKAYFAGARRLSMSPIMAMRISASLLSGKYS